MENYFTSKSKMPSFFNFPGRDPEDPKFKRRCEALKLFILPKVTPEGYIIVMCVIDLDLSKFNHHQVFARMTMMIDLVLIERPDTEGIVFISDCAGLEASIIPKISLTGSAFYLSWFQKAVPMKLKKLIFFNSPKFMDVIINTCVKPFLSKKLCSRIVVTKKDSSITKETFPEELLPCDFGGMEKSSTDLNNDWLEKLKRNRDWFEKTTQQVVDETKKLPDDKNTFGVNSTFRSCNLD